MEFFLLFVLAIVALILGIAALSRISSLKEREAILEHNSGTGIRVSLPLRNI